MNWKDKLYLFLVVFLFLFMILFVALSITTCMEFQRINGEAAAYHEEEVIKEREATEQEKAYYEEQMRKQKAETEAQQQAQQQTQAINIKEQKWQEAREQVPPLTKSQGIAYTPNGFKLTYYSSKVLYHFMTPQWRLDKAGMYRDWNGSEWCYVVSMNKSYGYGVQGVTIDIGSPAMVWDSGCAIGVVDMYCAW